LLEAAKEIEAENQDNFNRMIHKVTDKLSVLASGSDVMLDQSISADQLEMMIDVLMATYPVVFVDLSHSPQALQNVVITRANQINLVSTQGLVSLRQSRSLVQEIKDLRGGEDDGIELIINMSGMVSGQDVPRKDIETAMDLNVSAVVPFDAKLFQGNENASRRITSDKDGETLVKSTLLPVVQKIVSGDFTVDNAADKAGSGSGLLGGLMRKLSSK